MKYSVFIVLLVFAQFKSHGQTFQTIDSGKLPCWQVSNLSDSFEAEIIEYFPNPTLCGKFPTASIAIVKRNNGDTLRVVQFCDSAKEVNVKGRVIVYSYKWYDYEGGVMLPSQDRALTCRVSRTIRGSLRAL